MVNKLLEKEGGTSISLHRPTLDTPKHCCFPAYPGKWGELPALPKHSLLFLIASRITLYLYCVTAVSCFFWGKGCGGSCGEKTSSFLSPPEMLVWEILVFLCNFYKYTAKRKRHFGNMLTFWLSCFQFKPRVESQTGDHMKT